VINLLKALIICGKEIPSKNRLNILLNVVLSLLFILFILIHIPIVLTLGVFWDEVMYLTVARNYLNALVSNTLFSLDFSDPRTIVKFDVMKPPLYKILVAIILSTNPKHPLLILRLLSLLASAVDLAIMYELLWYLTKSKWFSILSILFLAFDPVYIHYSSISYPYTIYHMFITLSLYFLFVKRNLRLSGLFAGLAFATHYLAAINYILDFLSIMLVCVFFTYNSETSYMRPLTTLKQINVNVVSRCIIFLLFTILGFFLGAPTLIKINNLVISILSGLEVVVKARGAAGIPYIHSGIPVLVDTPALRLERAILVLLLKQSLVQVLAIASIPFLIALLIFKERSILKSLTLAIPISITLLLPVLIPYLSNDIYKHLFLTFLLRNFCHALSFLLILELFIAKYFYKLKTFISTTIMLSLLIINVISLIVPNSGYPIIPDYGNFMFGGFKESIEVLGYTSCIDLKYITDYITKNIKEFSEGEYYEGTHIIIAGPMGILNYYLKKEFNIEKIKVIQLYLDWRGYRVPDLDYILRHYKPDFIIVNYWWYQRWRNTSLIIQLKAYSPSSIVEYKDVILAKLYDLTLIKFGNVSVDNTNMMLFLKPGSTVFLGHNYMVVMGLSLLMRVNPRNTVSILMFYKPPYRKYLNITLFKDEITVSYRYYNHIYHLGEYNLDEKILSKTWLRVFVQYTNNHLKLILYAVTNDKVLVNTTLILSKIPIMCTNGRIVVFSHENSDVIVDLAQSYVLLIKNGSVKKITLQDLVVDRPHYIYKA